MKIRNGFVSNSSSSSFIIATKKELYDLSAEEKMLVFNIEKDSSIAWMAEAIFQTIENKSHRIMEFEEWLRDRYWGDSHSNPNWVQTCLEEDILAKNVKDLIDKGFFVYTGEFENSYQDGIENYLSKHDLNHESENIIIQHTGGF